MSKRARSLPASLLATAMLTAGMVLVGAPANSDAATPSATSEQPASQSIVTLRADRVARRAPRSSARSVALIPGRRPLTDVRTVLPVLASRLDDSGRTWLRIMVPGRPAGRTGWIMSAQTTLSTTPWRLTVQLTDRTVEVHFRGRRLRQFRAIVGASQTPTPRGHFFVEEAVALDDNAEGGPFALAMSARSAVLQEFNGGPGQIALHGTNGLDANFDTATSHGCIRLSTDAITWLAGRIDAGTPISVE